MNVSANDTVKRLVETHKPWNDLLFSNLRNTVVCGALGVSGLLVFHAKCLDMFGQPASSVIGFLMACLAAVLVIWNMIFGCLEAINIIGTTNRVAIVVSLVAMVGYMMLGTMFFMGYVKETPLTAFQKVCAKPVGTT